MFFSSLSWLTSGGVIVHTILVVSHLAIIPSIRRAHQRESGRNDQVNRPISGIQRYTSFAFYRDLREARLYLTMSLPVAASTILVSMLWDVSPLVSGALLGILAVTAIGMAHQSRRKIQYAAESLEAQKGVVLRGVEGIRAACSEPLVVVTESSEWCAQRHDSQ